jgi:tight adherence protein C
MSDLLSQPWFPYAAAGAIALAIFLVVYSLGSGASDILKESELVSVERSGFLLYATPILRRLTGITGLIRWKGLDEYRKALPPMMTKAGMEGFMVPEEFIAFHLLCGLLTVPLMAWTTFIVLGQGVSSFLMFGTPLFLMGLYYPRAYLGGRIQRRHRQIFREMPYVMDLLTVSVEAGMDFGGGIQKVVEKGKDGPLRDELKRMMTQMQLGTTRVDALREMTKRVGLSDLNSFTSALIQAAKLGSSIGPILRIQAEMLRTKRSQLAEEMANKAPVKMIFPIVAFIFPSVFLVLLGPVVIKAYYTSAATN